MNGTLSALTAKITNASNTTGVGFLILEMYDASTLICRSDGTAPDVNGFSDGVANTTNASACTFDLFGGSMLSLSAGSSGSRTVIFKNAGNTPAKTMALKPGSCAQSVKIVGNSGSAVDLCSKLSITVKSGGTTVLASTPLSTFSSNPGVNVLTALGLTSLAPAASVPLTITVTRNAAAGDTYRNLLATQPITCTVTT